MNIDAYVKKLEQDIQELKAGLKNLADVVKSPGASETKKSVHARMVLLVGGPCDGMRIEQEQPTSRIVIPVEGFSAVAYGVRRYNSPDGDFFLASPDNIMDSLAYMVGRYPQFIGIQKF